MATDITGITDIAVFRHTDGDGIGCVGAALRAAGHAYRYVDSFVEDLRDFDALAPDLAIVLGGAPGVYQANLYPFIGREVAMLEKRLAAGRPTLGICLGAQMMAKALGCEVYKGAAGPEIGWHGIDLTEAGSRSPVRHFDAAQTRVMQWHGDTFDLPHGANLLASSPVYENQIFSWGENALAFQCHIEVDQRIVGSWLVGAAGDAADGAIDIGAVRGDSARYLPAAMAQTQKFLHEWLGAVGIGREKAVA